MPPKDETGPRSAAVFLSRPFIIAVVVVLLSLLYIGVIRDEPPTATDMPEDVGARPTGAGTLPDGVADDRVEGLRDETSTDDFIDGSQASDNRPAILDAGEGPEPATSVEELDVPDRINEGVVEPGPPPPQD